MEYTDRPPRRITFGLVLRNRKVDRDLLEKVYMLNKFLGLQNHGFHVPMSEKPKVFFGRGLSSDPTPENSMVEFDVDQLVSTPWRVRFEFNLVHEADADISVRLPDNARLGIEERIGLVVNAFGESPLVSSHSKSWEIALRNDGVMFLSIKPMEDLKGYQPLHMGLPARTLKKHYRNYAKIFNILLHHPRLFYVKNGKIRSKLYDKQLKSHEGMFNMDLMEYDVGTYRHKSLTQEGLEHYPIQLMIPGPTNAELAKASIDRLKAFFVMDDRWPKLSFEPYNRRLFLTNTFGLMLDLSTRPFKTTAGDVVTGLKQLNEVRNGFERD